MARWFIAGFAVLVAVAAGLGTFLLWSVSPSAAREKRELK